MIGSAYLLTTSLDREEGWYHLTAPRYGDIRLRDGKHRAAVEARFERAFREQIPYDESRNRFVEGTR